MRRDGSRRLSARCSFEEAATALRRTSAATDACRKRLGVNARNLRPHSQTRDCRDGYGHGTVNGHAPLLAAG